MAIRRLPPVPPAFTYLNSARHSRVPGLRRRLHMRRPRRPAPIILSVIGKNDVILPKFDQTLGELAFQAQLGDRAARDALYHAFEPKLERLCATIRPPAMPRGEAPMWDQDDVRQEGYLVFVDLVMNWSGEASFTGWILGRYQFRLRNVMYRGIGRSGSDLTLDEDSTGHEQEIPVDIDSPYMRALKERLTDDERAFLQVFVLEGKTMVETAAALRISRRTGYRRLERLRQVVSGMPPVGTNREDSAQ